MTAPSFAVERSGGVFGVGLAVATAVVFGFGTTFARLAYDGGANPLTVVLLRSGAFAVIVGAALALLGRSVRLGKPALLATLWMAATLSVVSLGYQGSVAYIPVTLAALIFYSFPLLVGIIAVATRRDRMTAWKAVALVVAFAGLALTLGPDFGTLDWRGVALALAAALAMSLTLTFGGEATRGEDALVMSVYTNVWMLVAFAAAAALAGAFALPVTRLGAAGAAGLCLTYIVAYVSWYFAMGMVAPVRLAALLCIEPLVTVAAAWLILGERLSPLQLAGAGLVLAAIGALRARPTVR